MKETAKLPQARKLFQISKFYNLPINDSRITSMTEEQIELTYAMILVDNPKLEEEAVVYDEDFDKVREQAEKEDSSYTEDWEDI